jgi:subtilase family serine protease
MRRGVFFAVLSSYLVLNLLSVPAWTQSQFARPIITRPVDEKQLTVLKNSVHPLARPEFDRGTAQPNLPMDRMLLVLKRSPDQEAALTQLLDDQQDRSSPNFHKWLTPDDFGKQFGLSDEDIQTVTSWLQLHGFQVTQVAKGRTIIEFSGTAAQVQEAFHTQVHKFVVNGESHWANATDLQIPAALAGAVSGPWTLHNFYKKPQSSLSQETATGVFRPGSSPQLTGSSGAHFLGPLDYAVIYNINPLYQAGINGAGATIAVVGRTDIDVSNIFDFGNLFGVGGGISTIANGPDPGMLSSGEQVEALLDTSWSKAIAPGANIDFVISASTNTTDGVDLSELYIVDNNLADIMTESFGSCESFHSQSEAAAVSALAEQAAAQGITYLVSSGDSGASGCDRSTQSQATHPVSVNYLASTPFNIAVGGTMFNEHGQDSTYWNSTNAAEGLSAKSYIPENVWNESCAPGQCVGTTAPLAATGGGVSIYNNKPIWQSGVPGIPSDGKRDLPDVSLTAAGHDPYVLCFQRSCVPDSQNFIHFFGISGTSASAPSFAGIMALVRQKTGSRQGQANYVLYRMAAAQNYAQCNGSSTSSVPAVNCIFNDVTVGNNAVPGQTSQVYQSGVAFDPATGLGSPNVANLVNSWNNVSFTSTATTLGLAPTTNIAHGSPVNVNITVAPSGGTGTPAGDVSLLTDTGRSLDLFTLANGSVVASTTELPGGTNNIKAHYAGNGTFGASDSPPVMVTVSPESSTTRLSVLTTDQNGNLVPFVGGPYGSFVYLRADVAGQSGHGVPTGLLYFQNSLSTFSIGPLPVNSQGNVATPNGLFTMPAGDYSLDAFYTGDGTFLTSTSALDNFTITKAATAVTIQADKASAALGADVVLTANITTSSLSTVSLNGIVTFLSGSTVLATAPPTGGNNQQTGKAFATSVITTNAFPLGQDSITAQYSGDSNYAGSTSAAITVTVSPDFTPTLSSSTAIIKAGQSTTSTLTITGGTGFSGAVSLSCANLPSESACSFNPPALSGTGSTTLTISTTASVAALTVPHPQSTYLAWWVSGGMPLAGLLLLGSSDRRRRNTRLGMVVLGLLALCLGCGGGGGGGGGGGSGTPGTPPGTYSVLVTATSSGGVTHQRTFTLIVQQ